MLSLRSHLCGQWVSGSGAPQILVDPATEAPVAEVCSDGLPLEQGLDFARREGGQALRALDLAGRGKLCDAAARLLHQHRDELLELGMANGGNTRSDAKFDVDGAAATFAHYASLGAALGERRLLEDGESVQLGRSPRYAGRHLWLPRRGVALHVNAFNFPAWGLAEKAATAWLAGMPVVSKPATATALVAHRMAEVLAPALPPGVLSFVCGSAHALPGLLRDQDVIAFTGSSGTAARLRALPRVADASVRLNVEADSLNAAVLGPDVLPGSETYELAVRDIVREMTQKTGQKCTAVRRIFASSALAATLGEELVARLRDVVVGDPRDERVKMGPLASAAQLAEVRAGTARLATEARRLLGDEALVPVGGVPGRGYFVAPSLFASAAAGAAVAHELEVFGPVATLFEAPDDPEAVAELVARGRGALVCALYTDDRRFAASFIGAAGPYHGRIAWGSTKVAAQAPGPGMVMPELVHGGPGRAGGGEELGGVRGLAAYSQRLAIQGDRALLDALVAPKGG
ncbi:MAG: 3,4-dehydroadipyl-CoA semialdehyde dehydrogenase [Polyangiaceae bacterium]|nr:3,4-dehydroadipyl-CoA semialdehyde dehydrogenase [Polyangiaceae bacterium]